MATLTLIYLISFFLAVCIAIITMVTKSGVLFAILVSVLEIWIVIQNIMIAVKLKKFEATI